MNRWVPGAVWGGVLSWGASVMPLLAQSGNGDAAFQELLRLRSTKVITASRVSEPLQEAPATLRIITRE